MNNNMNYYSIMCLAWEQDEDGFVEIISPTGDKVCLNRRLSLIWKFVAEDRLENKCETKLREILSEEEIYEGLNYLINNKLIKKYDCAQLFDELFA